MKTMNFLLLTAIISLSMLSSAATAGAQSVHWEFPFQNPALTAEKRAEDLVGRLTLGEKVGLMTNESQPVDRLGIKPYNWWNEALHGVARAGLATVYPQAIGMAATFDTVLVRRVFSDVSDEARAKHAEAGRNGERGIYQGLTFWTPNINIFRDPRWGRGQETYGEDPYLTSRMAVAVIEGLQGGSPAKRAASGMRYDKLHACAKHFAVHSGPEWNRHTFNVADLSPRDLYETYLPAFKAAVTEAGVKEVMCAYNSLDGQPCCGNNRLLTKILRDDWHFDGIVVSDCGAVSDFYAPWGHKSYPDAESAATAALKAGTDITCMNEFSSLFEAVKDGKVSESELDARVRKLMKARFELGEMDPDSIVSWQHITYSAVSSDEHLDDALKAARESIVLLLNQGDILPLHKSGAIGNSSCKVSRIAVCGANATDSAMQWGNYNGTPSRTVTILQSIRDKVGSQVAYVRGCPLVQESASDAAASSEAQFDFSMQIDSLKEADTVIYVGGISPRLEGEEMPVQIEGFRGGDRTSIELPSVQRAFLKALRDAGKKIIFVNCSGSAIALAPETQTCDAILQAWYPGQEGGTAVADVLFGDFNPCGKLPVTFYRSDEQLVDYEDYSMSDSLGRTYRYFKGKPLFPFGYGLSYSKFKVGEAKVLEPDGTEIPLTGTRMLNHQVDIRQGALLRIPVFNESDHDGICVMEVYLHKIEAADGPRKSLRAFSRLSVPAHCKANAFIALPPSAFESFEALRGADSSASGRMSVRPGRFDVLYGTSSADSDLKAITVLLK